MPIKAFAKIATPRLFHSGQCAWRGYGFTVVEKRLNLICLLSCSHVPIGFLFINIIIGNGVGRSLKSSRTPELTACYLETRVRPLFQGWRRTNCSLG
jgi:hypothetical protein